jgi:hypothetical protein
VLAENLDALKCGGWGVFIAPTTKVVVGEGWCRRAHRTVRCASHVTQPLGFDRWSFWQLGHRTGPVHCPVRLLASALTSTRAVTHCSVSLFILQTTVGAVAVAPAGTPDSPVLHRTVRWIIAESNFQKPEAEEFELILPGAPDTVRWCTRHCSVAHRTVRCARPGLPSVSCSFSFWTFSFNFVLVVVNLWHL